MAWTTIERTVDERRQAGPAPAAPGDRDLKSTLVARLNENLYTQDARIKVEVTDRVVVLHGVVDDPVVKRVAGEDAWTVAGVVDVSNQLTVRHC